MTVPAYVDIERLCEELCISERCAENWTAKGLLPSPRQPEGAKKGAKRLWKWSEVQRYLDGRNRPKTAQEIQDATKAALSAAD